MKASSLIAILLLTCVLSIDPLQLSTVSGSPNTLTSPSGSVMGGTTIYITGLGFDTTAANNQVFIGNYPCVIPAAGATDTAISCISSSTNQQNDIPNLPISVYANGQQATFSIEQGAFSYLASSTPTLYQIFPQSSWAGNMLYYWGVHRISNLGDGQRDMGDVISMKAGTSLCGRFDINQGTISATSLANIDCHQATTQESGKLNVSEYLTPGYSMNAYRMRRSSFLPEYYQFAVLPAIQSFTPNTGGLGGQSLTITGSGFSNDQTKVSVSVDGVNCNVVSSTLSTINCNLQPKKTSSALLGTNSSSQSKGYFSGAGLKYVRYNTAGTSATSISAFKTAIVAGTLPIIESSFRGDIETGNTFESQYGEFFSGYFTAPVNGTYKFRGVADDAFALYINPTYGSVETPLISLISSPSYQDMNNFYIVYMPSAENTIALVGGMSYYIEVYHLNNGGNGHLRVAVEIPNADNTLTWQSHAVQQISTNITNVPEIVQFTASGLTSGKINLTITRTQIGQPKVILVATINYNATAVEFMNALNTFDSYGPYSLYNPTLIMTDAGGAVTTNSSTAKSYNWTVSIKYVRTLAQQKQKIAFIPWNATGTVSYGSPVILQPHGPLLGGSFGLNVGGLDLKYGNSVFLPSNIATWQLQSAFRAISGYQNTEVASTSNNNGYGWTYLITYYGVNTPLPQIIVTNNLTGGLSTAPPQVYFQTFRDYSSNLLVDPIDYNYLSTSSSMPNVLVKVNNLPAVCLNDCTYSFITSVPYITALSKSGSLLTLSLSDPNSVGYTLSSVTIILQGQPCTIVSVSSPISNFTCQLPTNSDGSPNIEAGSYMPSVTVKNIGIILPATGVNNVSYALNLISITPANGGTNGGYQAVVQGNGFPYTSPNVQITMCNQSVTILSINNIKATIIVPACANGSQNVQLINNAEMTNTVPFTYTVVTPPSNIFSINPISWNPALKGIMEINGTGFGSNISNVLVYLGNGSGNAYQMRILKINDTYIKCGIPGGLPGQFKVLVNIIGSGNILPTPLTANDFTYELVINSITPSSGSYNGGTLINLKGINFSPDILETLVFVGNQINWFCNVESVSTTDILCRTPPISPDYNQSLPQKVYLENRLIMDNTCSSPTSCYFSYIDSSASPQVTALSTNSITTGDITITGTNLALGASTVVVIINKATSQKQILTPKSVTNSTVVVTIPASQSGQYNVKVRSDPVGQSNGMLLNVNTVINSLTPATGSVRGGNVTLAGYGLPASWPNDNFILTITTGSTKVNPVVVVANPQQFVITMPYGASGKAYTISLTNPFDQVSTFTFTQQNTSTPQLRLNSSSSTSSPGTATSITLNRITFNTTNPQRIFIYSVYNPSIQFEITSWTYSTSFITFNAPLSAGLFGFKIYYDAYGWATCTSQLSVIAPASFTLGSIITSFNGGQITLTGTGISQSGTLKINGLTTPLTMINSTASVANIPPLVTTLTEQTYMLSQASKLTNNQFTIISDTGASNQSNSFDGTFSTAYSSNAATCFIGIDAGAGLLLQLSRIRYFPYYKWAVAGPYLIGGTFQGSLDNVTWTNIANVGATVHSGWNIIMPTSQVMYRYVRFMHNSTSSCKLSELEFEGVVYSNVILNNGLTSYKADVSYSDGANTFTWPQVVQFRQDHTPVVNTLSQTTGDVYGGYNLTLTGSNLNFDTPSVVIDGIICAIISNTTTTLTCTVGARLQLPASNSFVVKIGSTVALLKQTFSYVMRWSDIRTWGTDLPPVDNDFVFVPKGMNLLVDQSTPILAGILVENGTLTFEDAQDMTISAGLITVKGGAFTAGTEANPFTHKLTFVMYGSYYGAQQPMFGNKGIACLECKFSMHGKVRNVTWTTIAATINPGDTTLTLTDNVDWQIGEEIVVASTDFDHKQAEQRTIINIVGNVLTLNQSFVYGHFSGIQTYGSGSDSIEMRAEVGLLTRNIKMMGDSASQANSYGSHLMMAGSSENGLQGHIAYSEFTNCGQPKIVGRYCIHFHMNGEVSDSYVRGNAVHHSMARVVTLHGVHFLLVQKNVGYRVQGHNFFVEDGIQTMNVIQNNLAISSLQSWTMMQTDISVASFWITHPTNDLIGNHAAGSDFYGFWYQIKPHPDGPSAVNDVCPIGNALGTSINNVAHSNVRFGLRIFKLSPRTYPCWPLTDYNITSPWTYNPAVPGTFSGYTVYKNQESGILAEQTGSITFSNLKMAENKLSGFQFYRTDLTSSLVNIDNAIIVGIANTNAPSTSLSGASGIITPRSGNVKLNNIRFYNYPTGTYSLTTCSKCDNSELFTNTCQQIFISNTSFANVTGNYLKMLGLKRQIIYDSDATFSQSFDSNTRTSATIVNNFRHLSDETNCTPTTNTLKWDSTLACDQTLKIARVRFTGIQNSALFSNLGMKVAVITDINETVDQNSTDYTEAFSVYKGMDAMLDAKKTYSLPFVSGRVYNLWWLTGLDFDHLTFESSRTLLDTDKGIVFKFNYTLNRQLYEIGPVRPGTALTSANLFVRSDVLDPMDCYNGEYFHDNDVGMRRVAFCASGKNRTWFQWTDVTAIYCRYLCPAPPGEFTKETFVRYWSNTSQWPNQVLPLPGDNVTVNGNWTIIMDIDPSPCELLIIDGDVIIQDFNRNLICKSIWIRAGSLKVGSAGTPYTSNLTITITGNKNDPGYVIDQALVANKMFVVTGLLAMYGVAPATLTAKLTSTAFAGSSTINVDSSSGWSLGDQLAITPSFSNGLEYEMVTITAINANSITFTPALRFTHYGAPALTISNSIGTLDTRTSVGHLTRNIKIQSGNDSGWGYTMIVYNTWEGNINWSGQIILNAVEFDMGGQYDTFYSTLKFQDVNSNADKSTVSRSSFQYCRSSCIIANNMDNFEISDNVFFEGRKMHLDASSVTNFLFNRNLMIGAIARPTFSGKDLISCVSLYEVSAMTDALQFNNNICQGSAGIGFAFPFIPCDSLDTNPFMGNTAGSCDIGFLLNNNDAVDCVGFSSIRAFATTIGQLSSPPNVRVAINFTKFILVDNGRAVSLRFGSDNDQKTAYLSNSFISAISRPNCSECYGSGKIDCSNNLAVRMLATTINGQHFPGTFDKGFDVICRTETFDNKAFITNVTFQNYNIQYSEANLQQCQNNILFRPHPINVDLIGSHHLWNTSCNNCTLDAFAYFDPPIASQLGWAGGCGNFQCTGRNNYVIHDHTGSLLPSIGLLMANNSVIGDSTPGCTYHPNINGHYCSREDFGVLEYESIAPDHNTRIMWPVYLTFDGSSYTTKTNAYKQWQWEGNEPLNKRNGRFISLIQLQKIYNMTFQAMPPVDMRFQIQQRIPQGNNSDWTVIKLYYPLPNSISVAVNGVIIKPISLLDNNGETGLNTSLCGSNKFFYANYTIHFVVTGKADCMVRVSLVNSIQLTLHFAMNINDFYKDNLTTKLVDRMCALLQITDTSRLKIVGIYTGSVSAVMMIDEPAVPANSSTQFSNYTERKAAMVSLQANLTAMFNNGSLDNSLQASGFGPLLGMQSSIIGVYADPTSDPSSPNNTTVIIAATISSVAVLLVIIGLIYYCKKKGANQVASSEILPEYSSNIDAEKESPEKKDANIITENQLNEDKDKDSKERSFQIVDVQSDQFEILK